MWMVCRIKWLAAEKDVKKAPVFQGRHSKTKHR